MEKQSEIDYILDNEKDFLVYIICSEKIDDFYILTRDGKKYKIIINDNLEIIKTEL